MPHLSHSDSPPLLCDAADHPALARKVNGQMRHVEKERSLSVSPNEFNTVLGEQVRGVAHLRLQFVLAPPIRPTGSINVRVKISVTGTETDELIETLTCRQERRLVAQVPLAKTSRGIALFLQHLGNRHRLQGKTIAMIAHSRDRRIELRTESLLVKSGHGGGTRRRAHGSG